MKIKEMTDNELIEAMRYMKTVPKNDPHYTGWNFDQDEWSNKFQELIDEAINRLTLRAKRILEIDYDQR